MLQRRQVLARGVGMMAGVALIGAGDGQAGSASGDLRFKVTRNGSEIGHHVLSFDQQGERLSVDIDIDLQVRFAFITLYSYTHQNRETWQAGQLLGFKSQTNDNGTLISAETRLEGDELVIAGKEGRVSGPADMLPTTYWHRNFVGRERWIDTQNGRIVTSTVTPAGSEWIEAAGRTIQADRYGLRGDIEFDLWYQAERWVKLAFTASDGSRIDYHLVDDTAHSFLSFRPGEPTGT